MADIEKNARNITNNFLQFSKPTNGKAYSILNLIVDLYI